MSEKQNHTRYPKPGEAGGKIIRLVVKAFRSQGIKIPITSHIQIAISGGADSIALGLLLAKYGRRIAQKTHLIFTHFNHGWRGEESDRDEVFVRQFADACEVDFECARADITKTKPRTSPEEWARKERYEFLEKVHGERECLLTLTAHHKQDQVETLFWRLFTGDLLKYPEGVRVKHKNLFRPLLDVEPELLRDFLREEEQSWCEDRTNQDRKFLRNALRLDVLPVIRKTYPSADEAILALSRKIKR